MMSTARLFAPFAGTYCGNYVGTKGSEVLVNVEQTLNGVVVFGLRRGQHVGNRVRRLAGRRSAERGEHGEAFSTSEGTGWEIGAAPVRSPAFRFERGDQGTAVLLQGVPERRCQRMLGGVDVEVTVNEL
jgi:hypothetical protein